MSVVCQTAAILAGLVHLFIFYLESVSFTKPSIYRRFMIADDKEAAIVQPWALNQGFYNLFLAIGTVAGAVVWMAGKHFQGRSLVGFGCACMLAAALVLTRYRPPDGPGCDHAGFVSADRPRHTLVERDGWHPGRYRLGKEHQVFGSYREFFPYYVAMHSQPLTRRLHFVGTLTGLVLTAGRAGDRSPTVAAGAAVARLRLRLAEPLADRGQQPGQLRPPAVVAARRCRDDRDDAAGRDGS